MRHLGSVLVAACLLAGAPLRASAIDLALPATEAYRAYVQDAKQTFQQRLIAGDPASPARDGVLFAGPAVRDGMIAVPGGLIHHWTATAFVRGVTLEEVLRVSKDYAHLSAIYKEVLDSSLLERDGETYRVRSRLKETGAGVTAILDITSTITYVYPTPRRAMAFSESDEIRQVVNNGTADERLLAPGHDSGYLWHASEFTSFAETPDGIYVETDTIGLSRRFPPMLAWLIKPIARRLGRKSVETGLSEFLAAVVTAARADGNQSGLEMNASMSVLRARASASPSSISLAMYSR
jgi:hypothetical protein